MRYCSEDAPRTGERNVNLNKNTSENAALKKMFQTSYFYYIFVHLRQKARLRPELSLKFCHL